MSVRMERVSWFVTSGLSTFPTIDPWGRAPNNVGPTYLYCLRLEPLSGNKGKLRHMPTIPG